MSRIIGVGHSNVAFTTRAAPSSRTNWLRKLVAFGFSKKASCDVVIAIRERSQDHSTAASCRFHRFVAQVARSAGRSLGVHQGVSGLATEPSHRLRHIRFAEHVSLMQPHVINMRRNQLRSQQTVCVLVGNRTCARESHALVLLLFLR